MSDEIPVGKVETERLYTRRQWLVRHALLSGAPPSLATEAVSSTALEHPEWDMDEEKTLTEWEMMGGGP